MSRSQLGHLTLVPRTPQSLQDFTDQLWTRLRREAEEAYCRAPQLASLFLDSIINQPSFERDPACERFIEPFLYFKGFHAIQAHRLTHWLWHNGECDFALYL